MTEFVFKIWSFDRVIRKSFVSRATITDVIENANKNGIDGSTLVVENDGSEICDDPTVEFYGKEKVILMLLPSGQFWTPNNILNVSDSIISDAFIPINTASTSKAQPLNIASEQIQLSVPASSSAIKNNLICLDLSDTESAAATTTTLTMSSSALSTTSLCNTQSLKLFSCFCIPWEKFPTDILSLLRSNKKLGRGINIIANLLIDELRSISHFIPMKIMRSVAHQVAAKYPQSFIEKDDDGNIISTVPVALITKMKNRNSFLNRPPKRKTPELAPIIPVKQRRRACLLQQTCENWQPKSIPLVIQKTH